MKKIFTLAIVLTSVCTINAQTNIFPSTGAAGIGTLTPNASSLLDITSTSKGILIPRMTLAQRNAIVAPAAGLMIYQTNNTPGFYYYGGAAWIAVKGASTTLNNLKGPTALNQSLLPANTDSIDLGSSSLMWRNAYLSGNLGIGTTTPAAKLDVNGDAHINGITIGLGGANVAGNTAVGLQALYWNDGASGNTATGYSALYFNTGYENTANGYAALLHNTTGYYNTATATEALAYNTTGYRNTANGGYALYANTIGAENTADGTYALNANTTGNYNAASGYAALSGNTTGNNNTGLGYCATVSTGVLTNATAVGSYAVVNASNKVRIGDANVTIVESAAGSWVTSDGRFKNNIKEEVKGLEFIKLLRPVTYNFDTKKYEQFLMQSYPDSLKQKRFEEMDKAAVAKASAIVQSGFIAQEVAEAVKKSGYDFNGVHAPESPTDNWSLSYEKLVVPLVKAVQELSKQNDQLNLKMSEFENLKIENSEQVKKINDLQKQIDELRGMMTTNHASAGGDLSAVNTQQSSFLSQNIPNPFNHTTTIHYNLPQTYSSARIIVVDEMGKIVKTADLSGTGRGSISFSSPFMAGASYQYSLYVDGKLINTKQMAHLKY